VTPFDPHTLTSDELFGLDDTLIVGGTDEHGTYLPFLLIDAQGRIFGFNGHVDLGTGIRTALAQIVAEELDVPADRVRMLLGDTARTPDQGATIASDTIQTTAVPLRAAAAQARALLSSTAAAMLGVSVQSITVDNGLFSAAERGAALSVGELVCGHRHRLTVDLSFPVKDPAKYRLVGTSAPRVDIPRKAAGELTFVHDFRIPGMVHGRVIRPPYAGVDSGDFVGQSLLKVDAASISHLPGILAVVTLGDFVGVVAEREEVAIAAMEALTVEWKPTPVITDLSDIAAALSAQPSQPRELQNKGDVDGALKSAPNRLSQRYVWPYQMHASIGPSCAVAAWEADGVRVWSGTQNPHPLRTDIARLLDIDGTRVEIIRMEAAGCYGRNCADDVAADAALLSRAVGRPVRVQLTRAQEHLWEPKGTGQLMTVDGALDTNGDAIAYDFTSRYPSNGAPTLALLLTGVVKAEPDVWQMGDRTCISPYDIPNMRVTVHDMAPIVRASWLRGVSALPNSFAHESWIDEAAAMAGVDPVDYRMRYMRDDRGIAVIEATAQRAGWQPRTGARTLTSADGRLQGQGFAYALYVHSKFPGYGAAWAAWVADVTVDTRTGAISVDRITVGHDAGLMINPAGVRHQIHGNVVQATSRALTEQVAFNRQGVAATEWGSYPILKFDELPQIEVLMLPRPDQPPRGAGESASVPSAAAIANALYDATGVRFREPPFTPEKVRAALREAGLLAPPAPEPSRPKPDRKRWLWKFAATFGGLCAVGLASSPWHRVMAPSKPPPTNFYSQETLDRGRVVAALGACEVCHTTPSGAVNAGGRALETPFGIIYSTNLTPDPDAGLGRWSYEAFARAMREGVSRDGRLLYPAFPYTAFAKISDADLEALYGYLMSQAPIRQQNPQTALPFPLSFRPLLAGWNALFHDPRPLKERPEQSAIWNRGAYLVEGAGHCSACHSPRNLAGAELQGSNRFRGSLVEGWWAPPLRGLPDGPVPWTEADLYQYLKTGHSVHHGAAAGPMAPVIDELASLPDEDIRAMAAYLASMQPSSAPGVQAMHSEAALALAARTAPLLKDAGSRIYDGACAACHEDLGSVQMFAVRPMLALNSAVHAPVPDNLVRVIIGGIDSQAAIKNGTMPGFGNHLSDQQLLDLVRYVRARFAADKPAWVGVERAISKAREHPH
jgi:nicotinate dehydrogenase subunit B